MVGAIRDYDGIAISRYVTDRFSPAAVARALTEVYEELLSC